MLVSERVMIEDARAYTAARRVTIAIFMATVGVDITIAECINREMPKLLALRYLLELLDMLLIYFLQAPRPPPFKRTVSSYSTQHLRHDPSGVPGNKSFLEAFLVDRTM